MGPRQHLSGGRKHPLGSGCQQAGTGWMRWEREGKGLGAEAAGASSDMWAPEWEGPTQTSEETGWTTCPSAASPRAGLLHSSLRLPFYTVWAVSTYCVRI